MRILVFGGTGTIGGACVDLARNLGHKVIVASRTSEGPDTLSVANDFSLLRQEISPFDAVIWAQGLNAADQAHDAAQFEEVMDANVGFIIRSFGSLYKSGLVSPPARLVLISSICSIKSLPSPATNGSRSCNRSLFGSTLTLIASPFPPPTPLQL